MTVVSKANRQLFNSNISAGPENLICQYLTGEEIATAREVNKTFLTQCNYEHLRRQKEILNSLPLGIRHQLAAKIPFLEVPIVSVSKFSWENGAKHPVAFIKNESFQGILFAIHTPYAIGSYEKGILKIHSAARDRVCFQEELWGVSSIRPYIKPEIYTDKKAKKVLWSILHPSKIGLAVRLITSGEDLKRTESIFQAGYKKVQKVWSTFAVSIVIGTISFFAYRYFR